MVRDHGQLDSIWLKSMIFVGSGIHLGLNLNAECYNDESMSYPNLTGKLVVDPQETYAVGMQLIRGPRTRTVDHSKRQFHPYMDDAPA